MKNGAELIAEERTRQISAENWTPEHDDSHRDGHLAKAAAELAAHGTDMEVTDHLSGPDVWGLVRKHHNDRQRQLVIAGALIAAEIDRLQRTSNDHKPSPAAQKLCRPAFLVKGINWSTQLPNQLEIRGGKIVLKKDGAMPTFDLPDGTEVSLCDRTSLCQMIDESMLYRHRGA